MATEMRRILYVDSDCEARLLMQDLLAAHRLDVTGSDDEARLLARRHSYDVYIVTGGASGSSGISLCAWLSRVDPRTPIIFCSSNGTARHQQLAIAAGAVRCHVKPLDPTLLKSTLGLLLKLAEMESRRAVAAEQAAIQEELIQQSVRARSAALSARTRAQQSLDCMMRVKAYRAFRDAGGNRANFERMWPTISWSVAESTTQRLPARISRY
jgi:DNA-binding response OmpR family regulator